MNIGLAFSRNASRNVAVVFANDSVYKVQTQAKAGHGRGEVMGDILIGDRVADGDESVLACRVVARVEGNVAVGW